MRKLEKSGASQRVGGVHGDLFFDSAWPSDDLAEFLREAARRRGSIDINPWMEFSKAELGEHQFLRLYPRKVVKESNADYERMYDDFEQLPWVGDDTRFRFRIPERLYLSKIPLKPNQVAVVGEWTEEFVVPKGVRQLLEGAGFSGIEFRPIFHTRTNAVYDDFFHLYSSHILGRCELDIASLEIDSRRPEEQGYDALGCLCYDPATLDTALDFNRTGERHRGFQFPDWIVKASVREQFVAQKLKGWAFEPVLLLGSESYEEYHELWASFYRLLAECKRHTIRYQKPAKPS